MPSYRVYVGDELFVERRYLYDCKYLEEIMPIEAPPGTYNINCILLPHDNAKLKIKDLYIQSGSATVNGYTLEIAK